VARLLRCCLSPPPPLLHCCWSHNSQFPAHCRLFPGCVLQVFYGILVQHFAMLAGQQPVPSAHLDILTQVESHSIPMPVSV
jgi:hypothetical protein